MTIYYKRKGVKRKSFAIGDKIMVNWEFYGVNKIVPATIINIDGINKKEYPFTCKKIGGDIGQFSKGEVQPYIKKKKVFLKLNIMDL